MIPILQLKNLRYREAKELAQSHIATMWQNRNLNAASLLSELVQYCPSSYKAFGELYGNYRVTTNPYSFFFPMVRYDVVLQFRGLGFNQNFNKCEFRIWINLDKSASF